MQKPDDWNQLESLWQAQSETPIPTALVTKVRRQAMLLRVGWALEWLVALGLLVFAGWFSFSLRSVDGYLLLGFVVMLLIWALMFSWRNREGLWQPAEESVRGYLAVTEGRLRGRARTVRFTWILFAVEIVFFVLWDLGGRLGWLEPHFDILGARTLWMILGATGILAIWSMAVLLDVTRQTKKMHALQKEMEKNL